MLAAQRLTRLFNEFFRGQSAGGIVLLGAAALALALSNGPAAPAYFAWRDASLFFVNDVLMAVFFLVVGLEIKRELLEGEISSVERAALPVAGALGGMLVPAAVYALLNAGTPTARGWGVPMATDIAFALGILSLLGSRVPPGLKVFLTALAIADDLGAIVVIAVFYTEQVQTAYLVGAAAGLGTLAALNAARVRSSLPYLAVGSVVWFMTLKAGIHPTVAGVMTAMFVPRGHANAHGPAERVERALHPWVAFFIMPAFALANAGVALTGLSVLSGPGPGVMAGLLLGKPLGIWGASRLAAAAGLAKLPHGVDWGDLFGAGLLGGIGFTMSLFIADLSFGGGPTLDAAKGAILASSAAAAVLGFAFLAAVLPRKAG